jgi:hypothetical protein
MNCEWVKPVPRIPIDESKRGFPGINHLRIVLNLWFVELARQQSRRLVEYRPGIAPTVSVSDTIKCNGAAFGSDLENDLGFVHG